MRKYYYSNGVDRKGPVTLSELKSLTEVTLETLVWYEGLPTWIRVGDLPDLQEDVPETETESDGLGGGGVISIIIAAIVIITAVIMLIGVLNSKSGNSPWKPKKDAWEYQREERKPSPQKEYKGESRRSGRLTTSELARKVQQSIIETYSEKGRYISVADDLILLHTEGNEYMGAMVIWEDGEKEELIVYVSYDGNRFEWYSL